MAADDSCPPPTSIPALLPPPGPGTNLVASTRSTQTMRPTTTHNRRRVLGAAALVMATTTAAAATVSQGGRPSMVEFSPDTAPPRLDDLIRSFVHRPPGDTFDLPVEGRLPSFSGATGWLNSDPLTVDGLRGSVVLVDFWTYTCVNWLRTLPYVR